MSRVNIGAILTTHLVLFRNRCRLNGDVENCMKYSRHCPKSGNALATVFGRVRMIYDEIVDAQNVSLCEKQRLTSRPETRI